LRNTEGALKPESVSTKQERIAKLAAESPAMAFTSLNHYLDAEWLRYAYECTRKDGAVGVDGQTAQAYAAHLEQNLQSLMDRLKSGRYRALPVRRHYIDKSDGGKRALGIPSFEDKVAQRAIVMLLEPIYEQDFLNCSFGFRTGRNAHQALRVLRHGIVGQGARWVLEVDVRKYFDSIDHANLRELLDRRVTDGVVRRMIDKWLKAGVLEEGRLSFPGVGTPQGGVISPMLANVFLHYVLDEWFAEQVQPRLRSGSALIRYCDDFVMLFACKDDAERVQAVLGKRLAKFGLELHPDKTRLIDFRPPAKRVSAETTLPTTFTFLGFLHAWSRPRKGKAATVWQRTAKDRLARTLKAINQQCRRMRSWPIAEQQRRLSRMLEGHFAYFGITGNYQRLASVVHWTRRIWRKWLSRRSWKSYVTWEQFLRLVARYPLPAARIVHRYS
jgi:RNA-directed DNA polymerase